MLPGVAPQSPAPVSVTATGAGARISGEEPTAFETSLDAAAGDPPGPTDSFTAEMPSGDPVAASFADAMRSNGWWPTPPAAIAISIVEGELPEGDASGEGTIAEATDDRESPPAIAGESLPTNGVPGAITPAPAPGGGASEAMNEDVVAGWGTSSAAPDASTGAAGVRPAPIAVASNGRQAAPERGGRPDPSVVPPTGDPPLATHEEGLDAISPPNDDPETAIPARADAAPAAAIQTSAAFVAMRARPSAEAGPAAAPPAGNHDDGAIDAEQAARSDSAIASAATPHGAGGGNGASHTHEEAAPRSAPPDAFSFGRAPVSLLAGPDGALRVTIAGVQDVGGPAAPLEERTDNLGRLIQSMRVQVKQGISEATVRLRPEHLGDVTISIRVDGKSVSAIVQAESASVREWLQSQEGLMRLGLLEQGLHLDRLQVQRDSRHDRREPQEEPRRARPRRQPERQGHFEVSA